VEYDPVSLVLGEFNTKTSGVDDPTNDLATVGVLRYKLFS
jgi:hypothetical protein